MSRSVEILVPVGESLVVGFIDIFKLFCRLTNKVEAEVVCTGNKFGSCSGEIHVALKNSTDID